MSFLNSRYVRFTLNNSGHASNYLKASVFWAGPVWTAPYGAGFDSSFSDEWVGTPPVQRYLNNVEISLKGLTEAQKVQVQSVGRNMLSLGRVVVIPRPSSIIPVAIGYHNYARNATISASSSNASYPASNLGRSDLYSRIWRSAAGVLTSVNVDADLGSSSDIDLVGLIGFNGNDSATVRIKIGESATFASTEFDTGSDVSAFDTSLAVLKSTTPPCGRHLLYMPGITMDRSTWVHEAIYCNFQEAPEVRPMPTYPIKWEVVLRFKVCED